MPRYIITQGKELGTIIYYVHHYNEKIAEFLSLEAAKKFAQDHSEGKVDDFGYEIVFTID